MPRRSPISTPTWTFASFTNPKLAALRGIIFGLSALPAFLLITQLMGGRLGVNPVESLLHGTGIWALRFLLITLAISPLRWLTGLNWLIRLRRQIGLWAFFYAVSHFSIFAIFEHSLVLATMLNDIADRPYILVGTAALTLLIPLALTSTTGWIRRLGRHWKRLHWLIYPAAVLALVHFFWLIKADRWLEPLIYAGVLLVLLAWRLGRRAGLTRSQAARAPAR